MLDKEFPGMGDTMLKVAFPSFALITVFLGRFLGNYHFTDIFRPYFHAFSALVFVLFQEFWGPGVSLAISSSRIPWLVFNWIGFAVADLLLVKERFHFNSYVYDKRLTSHCQEYSFAIPPYFCRHHYIRLPLQTGPIRVV